jgi:hypothetical protein
MTGELISSPVMILLTPAMERCLHFEIYLVGKLSPVCFQKKNTASCLAALRTPPPELLSERKIAWRKLAYYY